jgi:hypothetical protein
LFVVVAVCGIAEDLIQSPRLLLSGHLDIVKS